MMTETCIVRNTWNFSRFYRQLWAMYAMSLKRQVVEKNYFALVKTVTDAKEDISIMEYSTKIEGNTICALGDKLHGQLPRQFDHFKDSLNTTFVSQKKVK
jgi:NADH-quinone oxidoreductase subunit F